MIRVVNLGYWDFIGFFPVSRVLKERAVKNGQIMAKLVDKGFKLFLSSPRNLQKIRNVLKPTTAKVNKLTSLMSWIVLVPWMVERVICLLFLVVVRGSEV